MKSVEVWSKILLVAHGRCGTTDMMVGFWISVAFWVKMRRRAYMGDITHCIQRSGVGGGTCRVDLECAFRYEWGAVTKHVVKRYTFLRQWMIDLASSL
jgi:hypothetical protein